MVNRCNTKEAVFSSVWAAVFFESQIPVHVLKLCFHFSCRQDTKTQALAWEDICAHVTLVCVALPCHRGCHQVGLKVIVFAYSCNICYAVLSFLLNWPWIYLHFSVVLMLNAVTADPRQRSIFPLPASDYPQYVSILTLPVIVCVLLIG